ncbi:MAG: TraR/DksA C4-type zinc finger protein [Ideonella sp.]|nr:TraR/DksA C4-type zinc finger protein [Ideonella sp.]
MSTELTPGQRALMQAALERRQKELERQIEQQLGGRSRSEHARDVLLQDGDDAPARDADREVDLARSDQEVVELRAVNDALVRLADDNYGLCTDCESPIPFDRLQRHPEVQRCVPCQSALEARSGQAGQHPTL